MVQTAMIVILEKKNYVGNYVEKQDYGGYYCQKTGLWGKLCSITIIAVCTIEQRSKVGFDHMIYESSPIGALSNHRSCINW
jgi:hypothetical protein